MSKELWEALDRLEKDVTGIRDMVRTAQVTQWSMRLHKRGIVSIGNTKCDMYIVTGDEDPDGDTLVSVAVPFGDVVTPLMMKQIFASTHAMAAGSVLAIEFARLNLQLLTLYAQYEAGEVDLAPFTATRRALFQQIQSKLKRLATANERPDAPVPEGAAPAAEGTPTPESPDAPAPGAGV